MRMSLFAILVVCGLLGANDSASGGSIALVAGGGTAGDGAPADQVKLTNPFGVGFAPDGTIIFVEMLGERVRQIDKQGHIHTVAGTGKKGSGGDGGPATKAEFNGMHSLAVMRNGDILVSDTWNNRVRKIDARTGVITTIAGTGKKGFSGDGGPATQAEFGGIYCIALDETNQALYLADLDNRRIRVVDLKTGIVTTLAGNGHKGVPEDGADARNAPMVDPRAVATDGKGNVYILDRGGNALRVVDRAGKIRTLVGTGAKGATGDGGPGRQATLNGPKHLCVAPNGDVIIADTENHLIRRYRPSDGTIQRVAGTGRKGTAGVGQSPDTAEFNQPHGVTLAPDGVLFVSDSSNHRILKFVP